MNKQRLLIIGWEGADWRFIQKYVDEGHMPVLASLIVESTIGKIHCVEPNMTTTQWASLLTGKRPYKHGVIGIKEYDEEISYLRPINKSARICSDLFEILESNEKTVHTVGLSTSHPAHREHGICISDEFTKNELTLDQNGQLKWDLQEDSVYPESEESVIEKLRIYHGETQKILASVPNLPDVFKTKDESFLLNKIVADDLSLFSAITYLLDQRSFDAAAVSFNGIERICSHFIQSPTEVLDNNSELILFIYRLFDHFLGTILKGVTEHDHIVLTSEYGYNPIRIRNKPRKWDKGFAPTEKDNGFFLMKGPNICKDKLINNLSILDITPSILAALSLPVGEDMDGSVNKGLFKVPKPTKFIKSWEQRIGKYPEFELNLEQLVAKIQATVNAENHMSDKNRRNYFFWMAKSYLDAQEFNVTISILETLNAIDPGKPRIIYLLSRLYDQNNNHEKSLKVLEHLPNDDSQAKIRGLLSRAKTLIQNGNIDAAIINLLNAESIANTQPFKLSQIGIIYIALQKWDDAIRVFKKSLEINPLNYKDQTTIARAYWQNLQFSEALDAVNVSLSIKQFQPGAHFLKGEILLKLGKDLEAVRSLELCLFQNQHFQSARLTLLNTYKWRLKNQQKNESHLSEFSTNLIGTRNIITCGDRFLIQYLRKKLIEKDVQLSDKLLQPNHLNNVQFDILRQAEDKLTLSLPSCLDQLKPIFKYFIVHIIPNIDQHLTRNPNRKRALIERVINNTPKRLESFVDVNPHMKIIFLTEDEIMTSLESSLEKMNSFFSNMISTQA